MSSNDENTNIPLGLRLINLLSARSQNPSTSSLSGLTLRYTLSGHKGTVNDIAWSPDGKLLASASDAVRIWDMETGALDRNLQESVQWTISVAWSPTKPLLAAGGTDRKIRLWDTASWKLCNTFEGHMNDINAVAWSWDGRFLASGSDDQTIRIWDADTGQQVQVLTSFFGLGMVLNIAWSPDNSMMLSSGLGSVICLWDTQNWKIKRKLKGHQNYSPSAVWSPDGQVIASGSYDKTIRIWDAETGHDTHILKGHTGEIMSVAFSPDGRFLVSYDMDTTVQVWRCDTWQSVGRMNSPFLRELVVRLAFHPFEPLLGTLGENGTAVCVWQLDYHALLGIPQRTPVQPKIPDKQPPLQNSSKVHILHLSDIHLGTSNEALKYYTQLQADLRLELKIQHLDYLVISGDVANKSTPEEYDAAHTLVSKLMERFKVKPDHVILAPGNHDLNWDLAKAAYDFMRAGSIPAGVPEHYRIPAEPVGCLVRDDDRYRQRFTHFGTFYKKVTGAAYPLDFAEQGLLHLLPEDRILFLNLNSAWEIDDHYRERSGINMPALSSALDRLLDGDYDDWLKFAVWHHPVAGKEMMDDAFLEQLTVHGFHVCLHGHIHEAREGFYKYDEGRGIHIVGAGTFGAPTKSQTPGIPLQYNLLALDPQTRTVKVTTRRKEKPDGAWMADARWGDKNNPRAWYSLQLGTTVTTPQVTPTQVVHPSQKESDFADLEIHILPRQGDAYPVDLELNSQNVWRGQVSAESLWETREGSAATGQRLFNVLFADDDLRTGWAEARALSPQRRTRLRLWLDVGESRLHTVPWELLQEGSLMLSADAKTPFSRYLPVKKDWGAAVIVRPLRALALIANPGDLLTGHNLANLDADAERDLLAAAFGALGPDEVTLDFLEPPVTLARLEAKLQEKHYHILHYVGHGAFNVEKDQAALYLQDDTGDVNITSDDALVRMLERQYDQPLLVFLAACQSGKTSERETFSGLGPKLVKIGIPAVVAMQDNVAIKTANVFSAAFYPKLLRHGLIDRAMNEARSALLTGEYADAAAPVLWMRLMDGRLWKV